MARIDREPKMMEQKPFFESAGTDMPAGESSNDIPRNPVAERNAFLEQQLAMLRSFISRLGSLGFYERNNSTGEVTVNDFWTSCGYGPDDLRGNAWLKVVHPEDVEYVRSVFSKPGNRDDFRMEFRVRAKSGEWRWVLTRGLVMARDISGKAVQYIGIDTDITEQKENEAELMLQQSAAEQRALEADTLRTVGAVVASGIDPGQAILRILQQAGQVLPFGYARVYRYEAGVFTSVGMADSDGNPFEVEKVLGAKDPGPQAQVILEEQGLIFNKVHELFPPRFIDGKLMKSWLGVPVFIKGQMGGLICFESSNQDFYNDGHLRMAISFADYVGIALENGRLYEELRSLAITDELTGLLSRRWLQDYAQRLLEQSLRKENDLSVCMIDVDWFKSINDTLGHLFGDKVLRGIAQCLSQLLRAGDIICRYGGEEFLAVLPQTGMSEAFEVAERLRVAVEALVFEGAGRKITVSIGVSSLKGRIHESLYELIHEADTALYSAKRKGRNLCMLAELPEPNQ